MARKQRVGFAVADAAHKTVVVRVERTVRHPLYKKTMRRRKRYLAHDEANDCRNGDRVLIEECRPLSRRKSWRVVEILERREVAEIQPGEIAAPAIEPEEPAQEAAPPAAPQVEQARASGGGRPTCSADPSRPKRPRSARRSATRACASGGRAPQPPPQEAAARRSATRAGRASGGGRTRAAPAGRAARPLRSLNSPRKRRRPSRPLRNPSRPKQAEPPVAPQPEQTAQAEAAAQTAPQT